MQHPDGLDCDLFISHAWQEGARCWKLVVCCMSWFWWSGSFAISYLFFPGQPGSLESMKNPYESTSVCKVTQLTTEVSLNFWGRWRTAGPGGCELLGAACWRIRRTWTSHRFWSPPLVRPSQWRCAPLKSCWWSQTDIKVSTRGCGVWLMQSHRFLVFTPKLAWTRCHNTR